MKWSLIYVLVFLCLSSLWFHLSNVWDGVYTSSVNSEIEVKVKNQLVGERESDMWDPWFFFFWWRGAGNGLRCFRKLSRIDWLGPDGGGHALWPRKWSQGTLPPHFLLRLSATAAPRLAFSFSQQTLRPFLVSVPPLSSTLFALTPAMWSYGSADIPILWVKRWRELDRMGGGGGCCLIPPFTPPT